MRSFDNCGFCRTCRTWVYSGDRERHTCAAPRRVFVLSHHDPEGEDGILVYADDDETAAARAIDRWDDERNYINESARVLVRDEHGHESLFDVQGEVEVSYGARAVFEGPENQYPSSRLTAVAQELIANGERSPVPTPDAFAMAVRRVGRELTPKESESFGESWGWFISRANKIGGGDA